MEKQYVSRGLSRIFHSESSRRGLALTQVMSLYLRQINGSLAEMFSKNLQQFSGCHCTCWSCWQRKGATLGGQSDEEYPI